MLLDFAFAITSLNLLILEGSELPPSFTATAISLPIFVKIFPLAANYEHITYEGYGPNGTAIIVETLTDNKNRTASNVKNAFTKGSGNVGTPGCVSFMFDKKGQIVIDKEEYEGDADELMMQVLDAGAEDFVEEEDSFEVLTDPDDFSAVRLAMEEAGIPMASAEVTMIPQTYVELTDPKDIANIQKTLDMLDDDDDVQDVYHNWDE